MYSSDSDSESEFDSDYSFRRRQIERLNLEFLNLLIEFIGRNSIDSDSDDDTDHSDDEPVHQEHPQINKELVKQAIEDYHEDEDEYEPEEEADTYHNCSVIKAASSFHCELCDDSVDEYICCNQCEHKFCRSCLINYTIHNDDKTVCPFCGINFEYQFAEDHILNNALYGKKQCIICYDWCNTDMICCEQCHQYYCLTCFMKMIQQRRHHHCCAYCRKHFTQAFIWVNTPDCFHENYFHHKVAQEHIDKYYRKQEEKRKKLYEHEPCHYHQDKDDSLIWCHSCGEKFEYGILKAYFKAIFEHVHMTSEHKFERFKLYCPTL